MARCKNTSETWEYNCENTKRGVRRKSGVPTARQRGLFLHPWKNTVKGLALHRPGRAAFHLLTKTISAGLARYVHCSPPQSYYSSPGLLLVLSQTAPLFCLRRVFPSFLLGWLFSAPCQI